MLTWAWRHGALVYRSFPSKIRPHCLPSFLHITPSSRTSLRSSPKCSLSLLIITLDSHKPLSVLSRPLQRTKNEERLRPAAHVHARLTRRAHTREMPQGIFSDEPFRVCFSLCARVWVRLGVCSQTCTSAWIFVLSFFFFSLYSLNESSMHVGEWQRPGGRAAHEAHLRVRTLTRCVNALPRRVENSICGDTWLPYERVDVRNGGSLAVSQRMQRAFVSFGKRASELRHVHACLCVSVGVRYCVPIARVVDSPLSVGL